MIGLLDQMLRLAKFVMLLMAFTLTLEAFASTESRAPASDEITQEDSLVGPPPMYPGGMRGRIPREPVEDYDGEGEVDSEGLDSMNDPSYMRPSVPGATASNGRFGETINKVEFKLISPEEEAKPKNPRAASYERYKKYKRN